MQRTTDAHDAARASLDSARALSSPTHCPIKRNGPPAGTGRPLSRSECSPREGLLTIPSVFRHQEPPCSPYNTFRPGSIPGSATDPIPSASIAVRTRQGDGR